MTRLMMELRQTCLHRFLCIYIHTIIHHSRNIYIYIYETRVDVSSVSNHKTLSTPTGRFVEGKEVNLTMMQQIHLALPCRFELHRYPFGTQQCNASFYIKISQKSHVFKSIDMRYGVNEVTYGGKHELLDYHLSKITFETTSASTTLTLHLRSHYGYHLLNSFAPSALMFNISYATLFFPLEAFNERIMASLTATLVLVALFAQASESYAKTPYFKLIDIWYAVVIWLSFIVITSNILVNSLHMSEKPYSKVQTDDGQSSSGERRKKPGFATGRAALFNWTCILVLDILGVSFLTVFVLFATEII